MWLHALIENNFRCLILNRATYWLTLERIAYYAGPLVMWVATLFLIFSISKLLRHPERVYKNQVLASFFQMWYLLQMYIVYKVFNVFDCVHFRNIEVTEDDFD